MPGDLPAPEGAVGLLVGYGSIGAHHARVLADRYGKFAIVDSKPDALQRARVDYPQQSVFESLESLAASGWDFARSRAVVATWGPSHRELTDRLLALGVRHLLMEKPMASSYSSARAMVASAESAGARLSVHMQKRISGIVPGLQQLARDQSLGELCSITMETGAWGLVTNGIHFLDFVCAMFDALPSSVISSARGQAINPRSPDLRFYEGTAVWEFSGDRTLTMTFSNRSSVAGRLRLWFRSAVIDMDPANANIAKVSVRRAADVERFPAVTRTGVASEVVFEGPVPGMLEIPAWTPAMWRELDAPGPLALSASVAAEVLGACIGALTSGMTGARVALPLDPDSEHGQREWPIS